VIGKLTSITLTYTAGGVLDGTSLELSRVAVLGAGTMGPGIAAAFVAAGYRTSLWARREESVQAGAETAERMRSSLIDHGLAVPNDLVVKHTTDLRDALEDVNIVVEAISEDLQAKRELFAAAEGLVSPNVVLASTTSGIDVDLIADHASHPERFVIMHFWNPAHLIPLVEVLAESSAPPKLVDACCEFLRRIGKHPVKLREYVPGFLGVRLQQAVVREAIALLEAGIASSEDIDAATRMSFGARFPVLGPLETSDLGGLDVIAAIHEYLLSDLDCSKAPQSPLLNAIAAGNLGVKTGRGFYDWTTRNAEQLLARRDEELLNRVRILRENGELREIDSQSQH
jgi:3-hydroxybutyryl-CoA dehydrogenase